ncbi:MAG: Hsp20/alpha crystallin family protein [Saprospiraceae bacterium]
MQRNEGRNAFQVILVTVQKLINVNMLGDNGQHTKPHDTLPLRLCNKNLQELFFHKTITIMKARNRGLIPTFTSMVEHMMSDEDFFAPFWRNTHTTPAVNVKETDATFELEVGVPGMEKKDFSVEIENGMLVIKAEREESTEEKKNHFTRKEFSYHSFRRSFTMPENALEDGIQANYDNGILKIIIKKREGTPKTAPKNVEIS